MLSNKAVFPETAQLSTNVGYGLNKGCTVEENKQIRTFRNKIIYLHNPFRVWMRHDISLFPKKCRFRTFQLRNATPTWSTLSLKNLRELYQQRMLNWSTHSRRYMISPYFQVPNKCTPLINFSTFFQPPGPY